jgi:metallo-beta-lactamase family protein
MSLELRCTLLGAAGEVTGSACLLETSRARLLVDFGMFQGGARVEAGNRIPDGLKPAELDAVLLTHAHLDHCGRLPLLVLHGFRGPIYSTAATKELAGLILRDSAKVQAADLRRENRKRERAGRELLDPLYTAEDAINALDLFHEIAYQKKFLAAAGVEATFYEAGHMLGSASIHLQLAGKDVVFSGDLGPQGLAIVRDRETPPVADVVFLESTYGDRDNRSPAGTLSEFEGIVADAIEKKKRILVPSFAVGRTQQILFHLEQLFAHGKLPEFPVYLDSPMAIEATEIFRRHPDLFDAETNNLGAASNLFRRRSYLHTCPKAADSMALNDVPGPCLIMAGAGMCTGGRILHHLKHGLWREDTSVIFVGYQARDSLGRRLVDGAREVRIFGGEIKVAASIHTLNGFSAHAGQTGLLEWLGQVASRGTRVVLWHGEDRAREPLQKMIEQESGLKVHLPMQGDVLDFSGDQESPAQ